MSSCPSFGLYNAKPAASGNSQLDSERKFSGTEQRGTGGAATL
jgi:hypothetical protein